MGIAIVLTDFEHAREIIKEKDYLLVSGFDYAKECNIPQDILTKNIPSKLFIIDAPEFSCYTINVNQCNKLFKKEYPDEEYPGFFDQKFCVVHIRRICKEQS